ncbi:MAG: M48 family metallopeptidase [Acidobacteria bacterium]|nr:M48 family metallopeptidase [Acidobacteriota bacterium]
MSARLVRGVIEVRVPARLSESEIDDHVSDLSAKLVRKLNAENIDLTERAFSLAEQHDLPEPTNIRWAHNQNHRWGSATPADGSIRISSHLSSAPAWVLDYVIVHELAHLVIDGHGPEFVALEARYAQSERAEAYLAGYEAGRNGWTGTDSDASS